MRIVLVLLLVLPAIAAEPITRLACGSCYKPKEDQGIWKVIAADRPQLFLFMGDNVYADTDDPAKIAESYRELNEQEDYATFSRKVPILPIWDDHDYGRNDAGRDYPQREISARLFFDAFRFPSDHEARSTPGVYHSRTFGPAGRRLQVILLDTRSFRSPLVEVRKNGRKAYEPQSGPEATLLGESQWQWLAGQLAQPADLRIVVSSIQVLVDNHRFEKWGNFPAERQKLLKLLSRTRVGPVLLLSGDRHLAEVARIPGQKLGLPFHLVEMTSSGMTHAGASNDPSSYRIPGTYTDQTNYGLLDIDWEGARPSVMLNIKSAKGRTLSRTQVKF